MYNAYEGKNIYAGENVFYKYGHKAQERIEACLEEHNGYISVPVNGGKYYSIGTSNGQYGEFAKIGGVCYSVNKGGYAYAKVGTEKGDSLVASLKEFVGAMKKVNEERLATLHGDEEDEEEGN